MSRTPAATACPSLNPFRPDRAGCRGRWLAGFCAAALACLAIGGCSRPFWRHQADQDAYNIVAEKTFDANIYLPRIDVQPDPRSRFYDPYDPDHEPLPPDDPTAHQYMHVADGIRGYKYWHQFGDVTTVENPYWLQQFEFVPEHPMYVEPGAQPELQPGIDQLKLIQAVDLATIHNRDYQRQIEQAYLAALDLTFERFQFGVRYLGVGGGEPSADLVHTTRIDGPDSVRVNPRFGVSQLLPAGGQLAVEIANNTLWLFTGGDQTSSASILSYSIIQPLLFGAGRHVVMEGLTQAERNVLYATRDLARFRRALFTQTVSDYLDLILQQQNVVNQRDNLRRLADLTELRRAVESQVPQQISERLPALPPELDPGDVEIGGPGIVLPDSAAELRYDPETRTGLRYDPIARALYWSGPMSERQEDLLRGLSEDPEFVAAVNELIQRLRTTVTGLVVAQLETEFATSQNRLRSAELQYLDMVDDYKVNRLGLPPNMPVTIDESIRKPFEVIDPELPLLELDVFAFVEVWAQLNGENPDLEQLQRVVPQLREVEEAVRTRGLQLVRRDFERVEATLGIDFETGEVLPEFADRFAEDDPDRQRVIQDLANDRRIYRSLVENLNVIHQQIDALLETVNERLPQMQREVDQLEERLRRGVDAPEMEARLRAELEQKQQTILEQKRQVYEEIARMRERMLKISQTLQVVQVGLRVELITLEPFTMGVDEAVQTGLANRWDLMNARARVMDSRRLVEIAANRLEAVLDVVVEGDVGSLGGGEHFDVEQGSFRAGVAFTAPLDQIAERNAYRAALINYQRARRAYMEFEDGVKREIRRNWRQLEVLKTNFETSRVSVRLAALQYDAAVEQTTAPGQQSQDATALLRALERLLGNQNSLVGDWINYEQNRLNIYLNMGIMELDANGVWLDEYYQSRVLGAEITNENRTPGIDGPRQADLGGGLVSHEGGERFAGQGLRGGFAGAEFDLPSEAVAEAPDAGPFAGAGGRGDDGGLSVPRRVVLTGEQARLYPIRNGSREEGPVHHLGHRAGPARQHAEFDVDQQRRRDDDDHLHRSRGHEGQKG